MTQSTPTTIKCILTAQNASKTKKLETNDSTQTDGFESGSGVHYKRYHYSSSSISGFVNNVRNNVSMTLYEESVRTELKSYPVGSYRGQVWKGYYLAPATGLYTFRGWAQYAFRFYISPTYGSAEPPSTPLISSNSYQYTYYNFFYDNPPSASGSIHLTANRSYYI